VSYAIKPRDIASSFSYAAPATNLGYGRNLDATPISFNRYYFLHAETSYRGGSTMTGSKLLAVGTIVIGILMQLIFVAIAQSATVVTSGAATTTTYSFAGAAETFTVPGGVTTLQVTATGGAGGSGGTSEAEPTPTPGGLAATAADTVTVTPGTTYTVEVAGNGLPAGSKVNGGFNGGGSSAPGFSGGGGGGGASDVCRTPLHTVIEAGACLRAPNKKRFWDAVVVDGVYGETSGQ
jgi:hypothetical protein